MGVELITVTATIGMRMALQMIGIATAERTIGWGTKIGRVVGAIFGTESTVRGMMIETMMG